MKKFKKAFVYALIVTLIINCAGIFIGIINSSLEVAITEFKRLAPVSISMFFVPSFLSALSYEKDLFNKRFKGVIRFLIPLLLCFVWIYSIIYLGFLSIDEPTSRKVHRVALSNGILSIVIFVFSFLIIYLRNTKIPRKSQNAINIRPSNILVLVIFLLITFAYFILLGVFGNSSFIKFHILLNFFINGLLIFLFAYSSFLYIYKKAKSKYWIILVYAIAVFIIPLVLMLINSNITLEVFIKRIKVFVSVSTPYFLFLTLSVHSYFIYLINKQEKQNLKQIGVEASLKYQQLKAQISPHFLFNNISVLTGLIEENQEKAVRFSEDLSKVYRYFLDQETQDLVTLKDEIAFANKYIALLKVRFENVLIFNNNVKNTKAFYILPMALQQVFENVVKHNELSIEKPMSISMVIENDFLVVSNTLHPKLTVETSKPSGLENINSRYAYFTDEKVTVIKTVNVFTIKLPLLKPEL